MYLWDELVDFAALYRMQVIAGALALVALVGGYKIYHDQTCCGPRPSLQCLLLDASGSTLGAREGGQYTNLASDVVRGQSERDGDVGVVAIKGDPAGESDGQRWFVGAGNPGNSSDAPLERARNQVRAREEIDELLRAPVLGTPGSALIESLALLSRSVEPGDTIHVLSDGLQESNNFVLRRLNGEQFSEASIARELDRLEAAGHLQSLAGVSVVFDKPAYRPGEDEQQSVVDLPELKAFWNAWGDRVDATVQI